VIATGSDGPAGGFTLAQASLALLREQPDLEWIEL
jgi:hypothetical protein